MTRETALAYVRRIASGLLACACILAFTAVARAQQFSAGIVARHDGAPTAVGRLSVLDGKVRIETAEHADGFFLVDTEKSSAYFVRPAARLYMDARQSSRLALLFVPVDPDAPCREWQAMAQLAGIAGQGDWRCERTGEETIEGRSTIVFRAVTAGDHEISGWIDRERRFPLQVRTEDGALIALEAIKDEPQTVSAFELPADYRKFRPEALIEQIKQSDVWVVKPGADPSHP